MLLTAFAGVLLLAVLLSSPAHRTILSTAALFLVAWFGPKGFASVVYGLIVLSSTIAASQQVFQLVAVTIVLSILLHSSTDVVVARWFDEAREAPAWYGVARRLGRQS
ncbi:hypothetical protein [Nonomuraea africana]|uniref:NhaP-type Na+/H+ or K+/H+ antiporter n=1 Tax=Nonomuraea africana TaxID=46171 RepID=A0ABR9KF43_9ACTN|nr:hypothetical protein [Nonomuraea africana]MBE1560278.1 NhaP-type Na+/H+ or K+/H+ antiporter [Nonomuraea africana]